MLTATCNCLLQPLLPATHCNLYNQNNLLLHCTCHFYFIFNNTQQPLSALWAQLTTTSTASLPG
ncbi:hypothetical protein PSP6_500048 [Paraburkholderia tropica]|nr:hypothetical protein PSP6_500048 [Paraburkholderia tropica]